MLFVWIISCFIMFLMYGGFLWWFGLKNMVVVIWIWGINEVCFYRKYLNFIWYVVVMLYELWYSFWWILWVFFWVVGLNNCDFGWIFFWFVDFLFVSLVLCLILTFRFSLFLVSLIVICKDIMLLLVYIIDFCCFWCVYVLFIWIWC